jgi:uncharacterized membrane protein YwaF
MSFFSDRDAYPACGIFSLGHFIFFIVIGALIVLGLYLSRNITKRGLRDQTLVSVCILWTLEIIKIGYNHIHGYFGLDQWFPLAFCSLFLYAALFALSKNEMVKNMGQAWLIFGGILGGFCYLIYPSTSLPIVQAFHFLAFHGMGYHGVLLYIGILYFIHSGFEISFKGFKYYFLFLSIFFPIAIIMDYSLHVNLMFFREAYNLPEFAKAVAEWNLPIYTIIVILVYLLLPYVIIYGIDRFSAFMHKKKENAVLQEDVNE